MGKTYKIEIEKYPEEYQSLLKHEMTAYEISNLGNIIIKNKFKNIKNKMFGWYYDRKIKRENRKKAKQEI